jgi:hypothetical protein
MEHVTGKLHYWTYLMTRWGVGWIAGSEHKAHGKMAGLFAQPYISPPNYDTVEVPSKKEILQARKIAARSTSEPSMARRKLVEKNRRRNSMLVE